MTKPSHKFKTVVKQLGRCVNNDCIGCYLRSESDCMRNLMYDAQYYLQMTLEKSERRKDVSEVH